MAGANNNSTKLLEAIELIARREALLGVNCQVISRMKNYWSCGRHSLLHSANVLEREENSTSPMMPTNAEAGPGRTNAIIYSFRPRCLPSQEAGIA